jgi:ribonuclease HII
MPQRLFSFDQEWRAKGYPGIAGVDEAGIGPWAGPVVAAAVVLRPESEAALSRLNDSKQLTPKVREDLFPLIQEHALHYAVAVADHSVVDTINILQASFQAIREALSRLPAAPSLVLFDGCRRIPRCPFPQETIVKGDAKSASIAAASVLAKVTRDRLMNEAHRKYPQYGFDENKGYGTPIHQEALKRFGPCEIHRRSYAPVRNVIEPSLALEN